MKTEFLTNDDFYPTPHNLIIKMMAKVNWKNVYSVLEPSAGKGDIAKVVQEHGGHYSKYNVFCIEQSNNLQAVLRDNDFKVIDSDFLAYSGGEQFDAIIMNPPFSNGDEHLLKAIEIMYNGQIVCLLNAETIKNPYSNTRKLLLRKLDELGATVEFLQNEFTQSERKTDVEIALIYINIKNSIDDSMVNGMNDKATEYNPESIKDSSEVSVNNKLDALVYEYQDKREECIKFLDNYYRNYKKIGEFVHIESKVLSGETLTEKLKASINQTIHKLRKTYWRKAIYSPDIYKKLTQKKIKEFESLLNEYSYMEFSMKNLHQFAFNLSDGFNDSIHELIDEIFESFTKQYSYYGEMSKNIHLFNGWKTNKAFKVNNKVIQPWYNFYCEWTNTPKMKYEYQNKLNDIDKAMRFLIPVKDSDFVSIVDALEKAFSEQKVKKIESTFFILDVFKKGTLHITFKDAELLRLFNIVGCRYRKFLPDDYATKPFDNCTKEEQNIIEEFEGKSAYKPVNVKFDNLLLTGS